MQDGNAVADKYVDFAFDAGGRPDYVKRYADLTGTNLVAETDFLFDYTGRITDLTHFDGGTTFADYDFGYDAASRLTAFDFTSLVGNEGDADYAYDNAGQLTGSDYDANWQTDESYTYDDNGNRVTGNGDTYITGDNNQLIDDDTYAYLYDEEGNRTHRFVDYEHNGIINAFDTNITKYEWDHRNRLTTISHFANYSDYNGDDPDEVVEYAYDHANRWVRKVLDSDGDGTTDSSTVFSYDGNQIALQFDTSGTGDAADTDLSHRYLWGAAVDQILADETVDDGGSEDVLWPLTDHLGSVRDLVNASGSVVNHLVYDAFGNVTSETAPAVDHLFHFTARPFDEDTALQNNLNRWYDPAVGRWLSEDPIGFEGGDANLYRYVGNEATDQTDSSGLNPKLDRYVAQIESHLSLAKASPGDRMMVLARAKFHEREAAGTALRMYQYLVSNGKWVEPLAAAFMENWLDGAPQDPYLVNDHVQAAISDKSGPYQVLQAYLTEWAAAQSYITSGPFNTTMLPQNPGGYGGVKGDKLQVYATAGKYYYALGGFDVSFCGNWKQYGTKLEFTGTWSIKDRYYWKPGSVAYVDGTEIPDDYAKLVEKHHGAKPFDIIGSWYGTMEFDCDNPVPLPFPEFDVKQPSPNKAPTSKASKDR